MAATVALVAGGCIDFHPVAPTTEEPGDAEEVAFLNVGVGVLICPACEGAPPEAVRVAGSGREGRDEVGRPRLDFSLPIDVNSVEIWGDERDGHVGFNTTITGEEAEAILAPGTVTVYLPLLADVFPDLTRTRWSPLLAPRAWPEEIERRAGVALPMSTGGSDGVSEEWWSVSIRSAGGWTLQLSRPGPAPDTLRLSPEMLPPAPDSLVVVEVHAAGRMEGGAEDVFARLYFDSWVRHEFRLFDPGED